jgi:HAD superfamily hydrolase (TIGR01459 family)
MDSPLDYPRIVTVSEISDRYDAFLVDLWGVLHDGVRPFNEALVALNELRAQGKGIVLISNSPRRKSQAQDGLIKMGISPRLYDEIITSGELTHYVLANGLDPWLEKDLRKCFLITGERNESVHLGLPLDFVDTPEQADFVLVTGTKNYGDALEEYEDTLQACVAANLIMVCANPDLRVLHNGRYEICAGSHAARYEVLGGSVRYYGKPYPDIYQHALKFVSAPKEKILMIGDNLETDILGAVKCGLDSLLIMTGMHAEELSCTREVGPSEERLQNFLHGSQVKPTYLSLVL